ncbi:type II toxin-antitoxin system VapB family antitoxin [Ochrobactrum sp. Q0168]|uniref:type II toxin-antitoxin system VapB family antitoxin n=1 Tax=Ochrobactrum sp. Q0168 TaxID=2793241 RepID=UPI0018EE253D|nr:type II toxin-antitoxin system VapB family antitoxin [Ochrobactrum sp. Q0168]
MSFNVNDPTVEALLEQVMKQSGIRTKVGAIRIALQHEADRLSQQTPLRDKLAAIRARKKLTLGEAVPGVDQKKLMDELWEDEQ